MPVSLKQNMNVEIREMINRDPWSLKQPIHFLGIIFALVAFICVLEFFVIPSQDHLSTNLRFLVSGACLLTWASTLSRSFAFYFICSHLYGLFMASFLLFYQVVKRLPKKLSSSAVLVLLLSVFPTYPVGLKLSEKHMQLHANLGMLASWLW